MTKFRPPLEDYGIYIGPEKNPSRSTDEFYTINSSETKSAEGKKNVHYGRTHALVVL